MLNVSIPIILCDLNFYSFSKVFRYVEFDRDKIHIDFKMSTI